MKALKMKVIMSAVVLLFALVATIGSTFAWFTVTATNAVAVPEFNIQAQDSLLVKFAAFDATQSQYASHQDPSAYKQTIIYDDFVGTDYANIGSWHLLPVSAISADYASVEPASLKIMNMETRVLSPTGVVVNNNFGGVAEQGHIIRLKFWVMSQAESSKNLRITSPLVEGTTTFVDVDAMIANSTRLAITRDGTYPAGGGSQTGYLYGADMDYLFTFVGTPNEDETDTYPDTVLEENAAFAVGTAHGDSASVIAALTSNTPLLVTVEIFIEGWDEDASNDIIAGSLKVSFNFTIAP